VAIDEARFAADPMGSAVAVAIDPVFGFIMRDNGTQAGGATG
jgi:hypothetical protein